jgi:pimeloyl-ACP methyl ester carboxylesterase
MFSKLAIIGSLATLAAAGPPDVSEFDWDTIEPSSSLNFTTCYEDHNCAKLLVPLDWLDTENPARASLALITRPAAVKRTDPSFGGTIIVNPGGPGGSGVDFLLGYGEPIQKTASGPNNTYEILSFDPRGVHLSTPTADCYREEFLRGSWKLEDRALGYPTSSHSSIRMKMARSDGFGRRCAADDETADIRQFISTASVARDMVEIVDQLAQLHRDTDAGRQHNRESQDDADRQHDAAPGRDTNPVHDTDHLELRSDRDATPRIMYWGISYGTVLGRYFASMFPGRIGRMLLEGVEDVVDYTTCVSLGSER